MSRLQDVATFLLVCAALGTAVFGIHVIGCGTGITIPSTVTDTARCILDVMSKDLLSGMTLSASTDDAALRCLGGLTAATRDQVQTVWGAHRAAEMREMHDKDGGAE